MIFFLSSAWLLEARHIKIINKKAGEARVVPRSDADWRTVIGSHTLTVVAPDSIFVCKKFNPPLAPHSRHGDTTLGFILGPFLGVGNELSFRAVLVGDMNPQWNGKIRCALENPA